MDGELTLIKQTWDYSESDDPVPTESELVVFGTISSIGRDDWYNAGRDGLKPSFVFTTAACNYSGERIAKYNGHKLAIYRTYLLDDRIELYLEERAGL